MSIIMFDFFVCVFFYVLLIVIKVMNVVALLVLIYKSIYYSNYEL